jgi:hypothetical protein
LAQLVSFVGQTRCFGLLPFLRLQKEKKLPKSPPTCSIPHDSGFARIIGEVIGDYHCKEVLETGTNLGLGSTMIIATALFRRFSKDHHLTSIEANPVSYFTAMSVFSNIVGVNLTLINGLTLCRSELPSKEEIEKRVEACLAAGFPTDYPKEDAALMYSREYGSLYILEDMLRYSLHNAIVWPSFILLDSCGTCGWEEFNIVESWLANHDRKGGIQSRILALDDVNHLKHWRSAAKIRNSRDLWDVLFEDDERYGFMIAKFKPQLE